MGSSPPKDVRTDLRMVQTSFSFPSSVLNSAMFKVLRPCWLSLSCTFLAYTPDWELCVVMCVGLLNTSCKQLIVFFVFLVFFGLVKF